MRFYEPLGFERRGRLNFETAYNIYMGLPGDGDTLELTVNRGRDEPYDIGDGYNHMALVVEDLDALLAQAQRPGHRAREAAVLPRRPRPRSAASASLQDPDGYRIELIDSDFPTPQDPRRLGGRRNLGRPARGSRVASPTVREERACTRRMARSTSSSTATSTSGTPVPRTG